MRAYVRNNDYTGCHFQIRIVSLNAKLEDREKSKNTFDKNVKYVRNLESRKDRRSLIITRIMQKIYLTQVSAIVQVQNCFNPSESSLKPGFTNVILALSET